MVIWGIVVLAVLTGYVAGGRLRGFETVEIHWWFLVLVGTALQAVAIPADGPIDQRLLATIVMLASYGLLLVFVFVNRWIPGARLMLAGLLLNFIVIGLNNGMPVNPSAVETAGGHITEVENSTSPKHHLQNEDDIAPFLGDVIPVPAPIGIVVSVGDVLLYLGVAWFVIQVMRGRSRENPKPLAVWFLSYRGKHAPGHWRTPARYRAPRRVAAARPGTEP